jgi:hypothetical protein
MPPGGLTLFPSALSWIPPVIRPISNQLFPRDTDEEIPIETLWNVIVITKAGDVRELAFEYTRGDGVPCSVVLPLTLKTRDHGTRLLNRFRAHGIPVKAIAAVERRQR